MEGIGILRTVYSYEGAEDNELSFNEGDLLTLLDKLDEDWWLVKNEHDQYGLVPSNYVQDAGSEEQTENIFEQLTQREEKLKELYPEAKVGKKWSAEVQQQDEKKLKGKLLILETTPKMLVFVHGKEKVLMAALIHALTP